MTSVMRHWLKFNAVGIAGVGVQLLVLAILKSHDTPDIQRRHIRHYLTAYRSAAA